MLVVLEAPVTVKDVVLAAAEDALAVAEELVDVVLAAAEDEIVLTVEEAMLVGAEDATGITFK